MPVWTPANAVINSRAIAENLLTYFEANQVEAILWAHGEALKQIARFENSVANINQPVYPAIYFSDDNSVEEYETYPRAAYSATFRVFITNAVAATAVTQARSYDQAIRSMIRNCPKATLTANTGAVANNSALITIEAGFEVVKANEARTDFLQEFQIRVTYTLEGATV